MMPHGRYVEQKNNSVVRRSVGYMRFKSPAAALALNDRYARLPLVVNFVCPCSKLVSKTRCGSQLTRPYDQPSTPFARVLAYPAAAPSS